MPRLLRQLGIQPPSLSYLHPSPDSLWKRRGVLSNKSWHQSSVISNIAQRAIYTAAVSYLFCILFHDFCHTSCLKIYRTDLREISRFGRTVAVHICLKLVFTAWCYASVVYAMALCLSVHLSVSSWCSTKMAKRRITQTTPHDSPGTLVFWSWRFSWNSTGVTPYRAPNRHL